MVRAKFTCGSVKQGVGWREIEFLPVVGNSIENDEFFKTTPAGKITLVVKNEGVNFEVGKDYYVDFNEAIYFNEACAKAE